MKRKCTNSSLSNSKSLQTNLDVHLSLLLSLHLPLHLRLYLINNHWHSYYKRTQNIFHPMVIIFASEVPHLDIVFWFSVDSKTESIFKCAGFWSPRSRRLAGIRDLTLNLTRYPTPPVGGNKELDPT